MTTHWDIDATNLPAESNDYSSSPLPQRKKLLLKPRTIPLDAEPLLNTSPTVSRRGRVKSMSAKGNPFGEAVPREQVLMQRGIDPAEIDWRIEQKATHQTYTARQEAELEAVQVELTRLEELQRDANERELPEDRIRAEVEAKRDELHSLLDRFNKQNEEQRSPAATGSSLLHHRRANDADGYRHQQRA